MEQPEQTPEKLNEQEEKTTRFNSDIERLKYYDRMILEIEQVRQDRIAEGEKKLTEQDKIKIVKNWENCGLIQKQRIVPKIEYIYRANKMSDEELQYFRDYTARKKREKLELDEGKRLVKRIKDKMERIDKYYCVKCKKSIPVKPFDFFTIKRRNREKSSIVILAKCSVCGNDVRCYGGLV